MTGPALLAELAALLRRVDPMPARVLADAEAAGPAATGLLVPLVDTIPPVRSAGRRMRLGRPGGESVLEVELRRVGRAVRVAGLAPPGARLELRWPAGGAPVPVTAAGYFTAEAPAGPVRLLLTGQDGRRAATRPLDV